MNVLVLSEPLERLICTSPALPGAVARPEGRTHPGHHRRDRRRDAFRSSRYQGTGEAIRCSIAARSMGWRVNVRMKILSVGIVVGKLRTRKRKDIFVPRR